MPTSSSNVPSRSRIWFADRSACTSTVARGFAAVNDRTMLGTRATADGTAAIRSTPASWERMAAISSCMACS